MSFQEKRGFFDLNDSHFDVGDIYRTRKIYFTIGKPSIDTSSEMELKKILNFLEINNSIKIEIGVHIDSRIPSEGSLKITYLKALEIKNYFVRNGIQEIRLTAKGFEAEQPLIDDPKTEAEFALNRRVELKILSL
jgi:outer membrane protein OmpA-like peptidoglycan-associated protein